MNVFKTMKWSTLVSGILLILLGIVALTTPLQSLLWLSLIISVAILVAGISALINHFTTDKADRSGWRLAEAILMTVIGVWMVFGSGSWALTAAIPYVFAAFVLVSGIIRAVESFELRRDGAPRWGWLLAIGIIQAALGVLLILAPLVSSTFLTTAISLALIGYGIGNIAMFVNMRRVGNYIRRRLRGDA